MRRCTSISGQGVAKDCLILAHCLQVAYLASSLFLDYRSDMIILVVNTLTTDLKSDNFLVGELISASMLLPADPPQSLSLCLLGVPFSMENVGKQSCLHVRPCLSGPD